MIVGKDNFMWRAWDLISTTVQAWVDAFQSWSRDTLKKFEASQDIFLPLRLWGHS